MFLLIPTTATAFTSFISFTFHYVSINTFTHKALGDTCYLFTFHYVSINTLIWYIDNQDEKYNLHSIMFLLILPTVTTINLHSIMFLLILPTVTTITPPMIFTFHYVSINTEIEIYETID